VVLKVTRERADHHEQLLGVGVLATTFEPKRAS